MRRYVPVTLAAIITLAIILRVRMAFQYDVWGSDGGEYYAIMKGLMDTGHISTHYDGWGYGYPYFPGMYILIAAFSDLSGMGLSPLMAFFIPTVSALSIAVAFLLGRSVFGDERVGLLAAAALAIVMPHVFPMSHTMPGSLGDPLGLLTVLMFLLYIEDKRWIWALVPASLALVVTHHLTNFFVLVPIIFYVFVRELIAKRSDGQRLKRDMAYIFFLSAATFSYWLAYAGPFRDKVMDDLIPGLSGPVALAIGLAAMAIPLPVIVLARRRWWAASTYRPAYPGLERCMTMFGAMALIATACAVLVYATGVPGSNIKVGPGMMLFIAPALVMAPFSIVGIGPVEYSRHGVFVLAWAGLISITLAFGWVTDNTVLIAYRQMQFLFWPAALLFGLGLVRLWDLSAKDAPKIRAIVAGGVVGLFVASSAFVAIPPSDIMGGFQEGTSHQEMESVLWCGSEAPEKAMVASDHRMSSMLFGYGGRNATWDSAYMTFHGDMKDARPELARVKTPTGERAIDHVLITAEIRKGVALEQWENAEPMGAEALAKFGGSPFTKVYDSGDAEIYHVGPV